MNNEEFNKILKESFCTYLTTSARSNEKLKILHGFIANKIKNAFNNENILVHSISKNGGQEKKMSGLFMDKKVDIVISKNNKDICGIAIKFVMSNYFQNSNNYFENMLGETSNIRSGGYEYFQIFIIDSKIPYFKQNKNITNWENINITNLDKYQNMSMVDPEKNFHIPTKTLIYVCKKEFKNNKDSKEMVNLKNREEYKKFCLEKDFKIVQDDLKDVKFGKNIIFNDFELFIKKILKFVNNFIQDKNL